MPNTHNCKIKAALIMYAYQEEALPYLHFNIKLAHFFQKYYSDDQSIKLDIIKIPIKYHQRLRHLWDVSDFALKLLPLLPTITKYDVIIGAQMFTSVVLGIMVAFLRKLLRRKISLIVLDAAVARFLKSSGRIKLGLFRFFLLPVDKFVTFSQAEYSFWTKHLGFSNRACYTPLGIDIDFFQPTGERGDYIFSAGGTARDFQTLISAMEQVDYKLKLIARGELDKVGQELFRGVRLPRNVELIPPVPDIEYRDLLSKCRFVVVPLQDTPAGEGISAIAEAMAVGRATVATKAGAALEYITDGETGLLTDIGDADDLRQKIMFLLNHPEEAERMGENGRREAEARISNHITIEVIRSTIEEVYRKRSGGQN